MGSEIDLNIGIAQFKLDLFEFCGAMKNLVGAAIGENEKEQARVAMKELIAEASKSFETIVDALVPLYELIDERNFAAKFAPHFQRIKNIYLKREPLLRTSCKVVEGKFNDLKSRRAWMSHLPGAQQAFVKLEDVCRRWLFQDRTIVEAMEAFFQNLNTFLAEIDTLSRAEPKRALQTLVAGLTPLEINLRVMQADLGELRVLGDRL
jgi:hypothetical protein